MYKIKEIYYTIQGEGFHTGRPAVFCRFAGCNLWTGREEDRDKAICKFCDTNFWGTDGINGGKYELDDLVKIIKSLWPASYDEIFVVCTGGEPALQIDDAFISGLHLAGMKVAIESNGTIALPDGIDWICISPKADTEIIVTKGDELKLVYPQNENKPEDYLSLDFTHFYLQPLDDLYQVKNTELSIKYCLNNPIWKLSMQTHKVLGID